MASRGPGDGYAGGCRRVQGPSEFLSVGTCAVLAPCLREARSCLVAAWCRGGCCPRVPAPGDLVLLLLATRAPYSPAVFLAAHHPSGECGPSPSWTPRWVGSRRAEFSLGPIMDFDFAKRTSASAAPDPSASAVPNPPASAAPPASANPQPPNPPQPLHHPLSSVNRPTLDVRRETTGTGRGLPPSRPRVLVFTSEQCRLTSLSPFQRREGCDRFGKIKRCEKLRDGGIEVEFVDEKEAGKALSATHFSFTVKTETGRQETKVPITVTAHRTKNSSQGVVYCTDLEGVSNDDIADGLAECGVSSARRIMTKRRGTWVPTHSVVLSFNQEELPRDVTIGYVRVKVRPYIPNPMRCYRCQRFGHTRIACRNRPACAKCASTEHLDDECEADAIRARKRAFRVFDRHSTTENLIAFRKARALARRTVQEAKRASWRERGLPHPLRYVGRLNRFTSLVTGVVADQANFWQFLVSSLTGAGSHPDTVRGRLPRGRRRLLLVSS